MFIAHSEMNPIKGDSKCDDMIIMLCSPSPDNMLLNTRRTLFGQTFLTEVNKNILLAFLLPKQTM